MPDGARGTRSRGKGGNREIITAVSDAVLRAGSCRVADLAVELGVSEVTVRKALDELQKQGVVRRFHGEARAYDGDEIPFRMGVRWTEKQGIAALAASLVEEGDTLLLEAGSAVAMFAERIRDVRGLTVITPNLFIARQFRGSKVRIVILGGLYQEASESLVGPGACEAVADVGFSKAFIGVSGFTTAGGFTLNDLARAEVTRAIIARGAACGAKTWILTDSAKFGAVHAATVCTDLSLVAGVVTDPGIPADCRAALEGAGVQVLP